MSLDQFDIKLHSDDGKEFTTLSNQPLDSIRNQNFDRLILLLHGFPDINTTFNKVWPIILNNYNSKNEKILLVAPKLRGYETSSLSNEQDYMMPNLAKDVQSWILELVPDQNKPVHLIGHDWGALIAFKTANLYPDLITSMCCLAIPYLTNLRLYELLWNVPEQVYLSSYFLTMQFSWLYKDKLTNDSNTYLQDIWKYWSPDYSPTSKELEEIKNSYKIPGVSDAITAYYRHLFRPLSLIKSRWPVDFQKVPTLIMLGENDGCMSYKLAVLEQKKLKKDYPKAQVKIIPDCGHFLQREQPQIVSDIIIDFLETFN
ncbi:uncharacterized protein KGF55_004221 [Candida pseudojiufengensis]|uniref:uncharacterized protein n=1 Tax=Candida pseudojiufengensis TaxID=497109 RepID=UPI002225885B|nr:uncharacterized protein KGF55_004221 [Candida pseudojiufengensis]KAI5960954.1 hypothetical protein KGF55_004221 [Candida pseudojiufengensis]